MDTFTDIFLKATIGLCGILLLVAIWFIIDRSTSPTFTLYKEDWKCTESHKQHGIMMAGKVAVPTIYTVCDRYERK